jgi:hypothetical protein
MLVEIRGGKSGGEHGGLGGFIVERGMRRGEYKEASERRDVRCELVQELRVGEGSRN